MKNRKQHTEIHPNWDELLLIVAERGQIDQVRGCISQGAAINVKDEGGRTPLMLAASNGYLDVVSLLVNAGARIDIEDGYGNTAFYLSAQNNEIELMGIFAYAGARIDVESDMFRITLKIAASEGYVEAVRFLINRDSENIYNNLLMILPIAIEYEQTSISELIIEACRQYDIDFNSILPKVDDRPLDLDSIEVQIGSNNSASLGCDSTDSEDSAFVDLLLGLAHNSDGYSNYK